MILQRKILRFTLRRRNLNKNIRLWILAGIILGYFLLQPHMHFVNTIALAQETSLMTQEIRYHLPEAGEVSLIWGINGWNVVPEEMLSTGTVVKNALMHTPMARKGDTFVATVQIPSGSIIDYGFLITKSRSGRVMKVWDGNRQKDYHTVATQNGVTEIEPKLTLHEDQTSTAEDQTSPAGGHTNLLLVGSLMLTCILGGIFIFHREAIPANFKVSLLRSPRLIYLYDLLRELVSRDMKLRYKRSVIGTAWSLLNPLAQLLVLNFVFSYILPVRIQNFPSFLFTGLLVWNWFRSSVHGVTGAIVNNPSLIRLPGFPVAILPIVTATTHLVHFLLALPILLLFILLSGIHLTNTILFLPLIMALQFFFILSLSYFVATIHVTFRDTQYLLGIFLMLGFYLSPVFYDVSNIPARYQTLYRLNPMVDLIDAYRAILMRGEIPHFIPLLGLGACSAVLLWLGYRMFTRASYHFVEEL